MGYEGSDVYNNDVFFERYMKRRHRKESPNACMEEPVFIELLGDITGKRIVDLGCGDAMFGKQLLADGCTSYVGVEGSHKMVEKACHVLQDYLGTVHLSSIEDYLFPSESYDIVVSRMALHYIEDLRKVFEKIHHTLVDGGSFVFSVMHPIITSSFKSYEQSGRRQDWIVDDYFWSGKRVEVWMEQEVVKYHRTMENYFSLLQECGFTIEQLREPMPQKEWFEDIEEYNRRMRIPLMVVFRCRK
ncbi:class I SAM-dependent DNA methyltransferase [Priestia taiwanensis]|uniref:Methyltransferase n=1 Tax=Priestia taiwanensis TaxID=1347902 RepID=A0A917ERU3_9BACI|nr:class I SAM-dependent methyltransferase [Priestia taiwanensis]MBM7364681.1 SAM-dependent methyltransferase [Priestia taiwanensis]GGE78857.1 methyltransferase [Priestia taiwanensis]